ncbi:uncharacterized protein CDAR_449541 [Caerostris darwini]|uniref:Uncharacterized protein n=1 Tax=Caerostris darwini TaxID=1538125 RepID=A0AAV4QVA7_9ARAC|nr:uncharacterized protein CDAR_449541 [Caerostris darwini]
MQPSSLYQHSQRKTIDHLRTADISENTFREIPDKVLKELVEYTLSLHWSKRPDVSKLSLLICNPRLQRLDLKYLEVSILNSEDFAESLRTNLSVCSSLISIMANYKFPRLKYIHMPFLINENTEFANMIRGCENLETLHTGTCFDLNCLENTTRLREARFHFHISDIAKSECHFDERIYSLTNLRDLEIFAFCFPNDCFERSGAITDVLICCPNIISVGLMDTSMSIHHIIERKGRFFEFKLRRCFWGICYDTTIQWSVRAANYIISSTDIIRNAARACPLVEELAMQVFQKDSLISLSRLSRLTFLSLSFKQCNDSYLSEFIYLMGKIGHKIKHLSLEGFNSAFPVNDICKLCINLESLKIIGFSCVSHPAKPLPSLHNLKSFTADEIDQNCFDFVLSNCPNLTELFLHNVHFLNDLKLNKILRKNPLRNLEIFLFEICVLTKDGVSQLINSAINLKKCYIIDSNNIVESVIKELNLNIDCNVRPEDIFQRKLHPCSF